MAGFGKTIIPGPVQDPVPHSHGLHQGKHRKGRGNTVLGAGGRNGT